MLSGTAALGAALLADTRRKAFAADVDVVIVGAGAAGIGAARELVRRGKSVMIVEASRRAGGRLWTDNSLGVPFEAGASFIHFSDRNPWTSIASEFGVPAQPGSWSGWSQGYRDGKPLSAEETSARAAGMAEANALIDDIDVSETDMSFAAALAKASDAAKAVTLQRSQMAMGEEPDRLSVLDWQELWSGNNLVVPGGYGTLAARAAAALPLKLGTRVNAIRWDGPGVVVETSGGTITARAVVVTVSVGILKAAAISFFPRLPASFDRALDGLRMGALTKIALKTDANRFDRGANSGFSDMTGGSAMVAQLFPGNTDLVIANLGGDAARALCEEGEAASIDHAVGRLAAILGSDFRKSVQLGRLAGWWSDPLHRGSYSYAMPGRFPAREQLAKPIGDRIWFAGEAMAGPASVTAGGATLSGERAAREIMARIKV